MRYPYSMGSSPPGASGPARSPLRHGLPTGSQILWASLAQVWGPPRAAGGGLLLRGPPRAAGTACPATGCPMAAGKPLLRRLELLLSSFCTDQGLQSRCPPIVSLLYSPANAVTQGENPSELCYPRGATITAAGLGLGQGWHRLHQTWGKLLAASHRSHSCSPPLPKPGHANPSPFIMKCL